MVLLLKGGVEDGLALESGALGDALDGSGQVCSLAEQGDSMGQTEFISVRMGVRNKIRSLGLENPIHQHPLFSFFCPRQGLLEFPHQGFPLGDLRISLVEKGLRLKIEGIIRFQNHKHAVARPENLDV